MQRKHTSRIGITIIVALLGGLLLTATAQAAPPKRDRHGGKSKQKYHNNKYNNDHQHKNSRHHSKSRHRDKDRDGFSFSIRIGDHGRRGGHRGHIPRAGPRWRQPNTRCLHGRHERVWVPPVHETRYRSCGTGYKVLIRSGFFKLVWRSGDCDDCYRPRHRGPRHRSHHRGHDRGRHGGRHHRGHRY